MASPQIEHGYMRIANELWDEIIRRDFTKRQLSIVHLIWRLSYGTGKKYAEIPKRVYFELCGVSNTKIYKELVYLRECRVLIWDKLSTRYEINKDHDQWQIPPNRGWNTEKFKELVHINIREGHSRNGSNTPKTGGYEHSEDSRNGRGTPETGVWDLNKETPEKGEKLPKREKNSRKGSSESYPHSQNRSTNTPKTGVSTRDKPSSGAGYTPRKDSIKDYEDEEEYISSSSEKTDQVNTKAIMDLLAEEGLGILPGPTLREDLSYWIEEGGFDEPHEIIQLAVKEAARNNAKSWVYIDRILQDWKSQNIKTAVQAKGHLKKWRTHKRASIESGKRYVEPIGGDSRTIEKKEPVREYTPEEERKAKAKYQELLQKIKQAREETTNY